MRDFSSVSHQRFGLPDKSQRMIKNVVEFTGRSRSIAVGSIVAVAGVGMIVTVLMAGALGRDSPEVAPIVIDTPVDGAGFDGGVDGEERSGTIDDRAPSDDSMPPRRVDSTSADAPAVRSGQDSSPSGPVPTAPPPPPVTAAPAVAGGGDPVEPDEDDGPEDQDDAPEDQDGSDGDGPGEDD